MSGLRYVWGVSVGLAWSARKLVSAAQVSSLVSTVTGH
jgi:hypothetical protein